MKTGKEDESEAERTRGGTARAGQGVQMGRVWGIVRMSETCTGAGWR
jgi:hypothetical protein